MMTPTVTLANAPDYLTPQEARDLLRISRTTMYEYLRNQTIACKRIGRKILIPKSSIKKMMGEV